MKHAIFERQKNGEMMKFPVQWQDQTDQASKMNQVM